MAFKTHLHSFRLFIVKMFQDNLDSVNSHAGKRAKGLIRMFARDPGITYSKQSLDQTARTSHETATAVNTHCYWIGKGNAADANASSGTSDKASRFSKFIPEVTVTHALPASHAAGSRPRDNPARPRAAVPTAQGHPPAAATLNQLQLRRQFHTRPNLIQTRAATLSGTSTVSRRVLLLLRQQ